MKTYKTKLDGVLMIEIDIFEDERGSFYESYQIERYSSFGIGDIFEQDNFSSSKKNVIRGLHYQKKNPQSQLLTIMSGSIFDVLVALRRSSTTFKNKITMHLGDSYNFRQIYMPPGIAHGFCVLSDQADLHYKVNKKYIPENEGGILWSDNDLDIKWPIKKPVISKKDQLYKQLKDLKEIDFPENL